jgi:hypothetical protein
METLLLDEFSTVSVRLACMETLLLDEFSTVSVRLRLE